MESVELTRGAIAAISEGDMSAEGMKPVVQVYDLKQVMQGQATQERYRMLLSDGISFQQAMLATQMNELVKSGTLQKYSIVKLNEFICNVIQNRKIIIVINLQVLVNKTDPVGDPKIYDPSASQNRAAAPVQSSMSPIGVAAPNPQNFVGSHSNGLIGRQNLAAGVSLNPNPQVSRKEASYSGSFANGPTPGRNAGVGIQPKADHGTARYAEPHLDGGNLNQRSSNAGTAGSFRPPASTYGRPVQNPYQQPPPLYSNRGPIAKNENPARIIPIAALNPYQGRWTIKARVTSKGELRRYNNPRGEGKVFSFDLLDSDGGEIRVTGFNMMADQFYDMIEAGKVYMISKGSLKPARKNFNHLNNDYEIFLESTSTVQPCLEEDDSIPKQQFNFRSVNEIEGLENNAMADVIGVVTSINPSTTIMRKNGTEIHKRTLQLKDMSGCSVEVTLWGSFCNIDGQQLQGLCDSGEFPILAVKAAKVSDFNGKSLGTISSSQLFINPEFPEAHKLREWYNRDGKNAASLSISRDTSAMGRMDARKTVSQIKDEGLGRAEKPDWITVKATITFVKNDSFCYTACPMMVGDRQCNKKVNNNGDGTWQCDRCEKSFPECDYRYLLQLQINDHTGMTWVTAFQEAGEEIMGVGAKELYLLKHEEQDDAKFAEIIKQVMFNQLIFKLKIKEETFSDEQRVKSTVVKADKINPSVESKHLLGVIEKLLAEDANVTSGHGNYVASEISNIAYGNSDGNIRARAGTNEFSSNGTELYRGANHPGERCNEFGGGMNHFTSRESMSLCKICGSSGHTDLNCPRSINQHGQSSGGGFTSRSMNTSMDHGTSSDVCYKCQQPGHWARDCPGANAAATSAYGSNVGGRYNRQHIGGY